MAHDTKLDASQCAVRQRGQRWERVVDEEAQLASDVVGIESSRRRESGGKREGDCVRDVIAVSVGGVELKAGLIVVYREDQAGDTAPVACELNRHENTLICIAGDVLRDG